MEYMFRTLQNFGGLVSNSRKIACFSEPVSAQWVERLNSIGVLIKIVKNIDQKCVHANKIQMLNIDEHDFDYLVALDTDIVIAKDFSEFLTGSEIQAKPVDNDPLSIDQWKNLFNYFGLELTSTRYLTSFTMTETIPYFNSGVLIIPQKHVQILYETWKSFVHQLLKSYDDLPDIQKHSFFTDQFALALSVAKIGLPHKPLPLEMNFPTHVPIHKDLNPEKINPYLIHYHHRLTQDEKIMSCNYENINKIIEKINKSLDNKQSESKIENNKTFSTPNFNNSTFWENRYNTNPQLGSGIGSREPYLSYKKELIAEILQQYNPGTVLDVGCGDLEVVKELEISNYTGIDVSSTVLSKNKNIKPKWNFIQGNFLDIIKNNNVKADLVMCLDVLIHQHDYQSYHDFVGALVESSNLIGIISAYEWFPRGNYRSEITAYHEPITKTLKKFGISKIEVIGVYRDTCVILFHK